MSYEDSQAGRSSSASGRDKLQMPPDQTEKISQIEKSVTHLLVATKQLLEILTAWSRREASEVNVSDVYVRLGYEFNIACRAFNGIGVETQDLGPVPDLLRNILEDTLSNEPSQASLEQYLPRIRDIIVNLLQGLKKKQQRLRQRAPRDVGTTSAAETRQPSSANNSIAALEESDDRQSSKSNLSMRQGNNEPQAPSNGATVPYRMSSAPAGRVSPNRTDSIPARRAGSTNRGPLESAYSIPPTVTPVYSNPFSVSVPQPGAYTPGNVDSGPREPNQPSLVSQIYLQPQPQPQQEDALAALQRGGELERRASRRFSAYQIQKHLGATSSGIPMIPPTQHSPIPNRGRETRENMSAVKMRGSPLSSADRLRTDHSLSPTRQSVQAKLIEQPTNNSTIPLIEGPFDDNTDDSPTIKTPEDKLGPSFRNPRTGDPSAPQNGTNAESHPGPSTPNGQAGGHPIRRQIVRKQVSRSDLSADTPVTPPPTKELILFLQYKTKIKRFSLPEGYEELSIARLQLAFIEKFAWNTHSNGVDLPDIYIQDPMSGVRYELEDLSDIKNNSVLILNVDALDDVKRHLDNGLGSLKNLVEGVRSAIDDQQSILQLVSDTQADAAKSIARFNAAPPSVLQDLSALTYGDAPSVRGTFDRLGEIQSLRRDLAVMRQTYTSLMSDMEASMSNLRAKANTVKAAAITAAIPEFDSTTGRGYVNAGRKTLSDDSEKIINRVDDLQDVVEDLRKDVVSRGVRPLPRQLEGVSKEISNATAELKKLQEFIKREKPVWTKIWRNELELVYDDQKSLNMQEELAADLEKDLTEAANTFSLVEEATKQQNIQVTQGTPTRSLSRTLTPSNPDLDPQKAKDGVLGEVRALQPNHETRLEAIERAEKARQRELQSRGEGGFKKELGSFVDEGKLKKSGGVEEAERQRKAKDDSIRRQVWERTNGNVADQVHESPPVQEKPLMADEVLEEAMSSGESDLIEVRDPASEASKEAAEGLEGIERAGTFSKNEDRETLTPEPEFVEAVEQPIAAEKAGSYEA